MTSSCTRYILCLLVTCYGLNLASAQGSPRIGSALYQLTGGNALVDNKIAPFYADPSGLAEGPEGITSSLSGNNLFGTDIRSGSATANWTRGNQSFGALLGSYGIEGFRQNQVSLAYARKLSDNTRLGLMGHYYVQNIDELANQSEVDFTLGIQQDLSDNWSIGAYIFNPLTRDNYSRENSGIGINTAGKLSTFLTIYVSGIIPFSGKSSIRPGLKYAIAEFLKAYWSIDTSATSYNYGVELGITQNWNIILALNTHHQLGNSIYFSTFYSIL